MKVTLCDCCAGRTSSKNPPIFVTLGPAHVFDVCLRCLEGGVSFYVKEGKAHIQRKTSPQDGGGS